MLLAWIVLASVATADQTLEDGSLRADVVIDTSKPTFGTLSWLSGGGKGAANVLSSQEPGPAWAVDLVTAGASPGKTYSLNSMGKGIERAVLSANRTAADLAWSCSVGGAQVALVNVTLRMRLEGGLLRQWLSIESTSAAVGVWQWSLSPISNGMTSGTTRVFEPSGFGIELPVPAKFDRTYPSPMTMQFMAAYAGGASPSEPAAGVYVAAHDPLASFKTLQLDASPPNSEKCCSKFTVLATPPSAGLPLASNPVSVEWPTVVGVFSGNWWDASQIYRTWALAEAMWTRQGPLSTRDRGVPEGLLDMTVWVNSHWQGNDIFNLTGGDPAVVLDRVGSIADRFGLDSGALGLHWYEWDTLGYAYGSNYSNCTTEVTCGFDTHYPEYFGERKGFNDTLKALQDRGVRVAPYINGRIFDMATSSWTADAQQAAVKTAATSLGADKLSYSEESYGSKALFAAMCPHTQYWQNTIASVVSRIANGLKTDGVYVDQIGAAHAEPCWDRSHNHTLGGGSFWYKGYDAMLSLIREQVGKDKIILTESNAEPYMAGIDLYLTLVAFGSGNLSPGSGDTIVPAFQAVYGGYTMSMGAEFFQNDFDPNPDVFAAKIAIQFLFGAQMGWMSLGGRDNQNPPMGVYDMLMSPKYDAEVEFLKTLSKAKQKVSTYLNHGRAMRPIELKLNVTGSNKLSSIPDHPRRSGRGEQDRVDGDLGVAFDTVLSCAWLDEAGGSLLIALANVRRGVPAEASLNIDMSLYGFPESATAQFVVRQEFESPDTPTKNIGKFPARAVAFKAALSQRSVALFVLEPLQREGS